MKKDKIKKVVQKCIDFCVHYKYIFMPIGAVLAIIVFYILGKSYLNIVDKKSKEIVNGNQNIIVSTLDANKESGMIIANLKGDLDTEKVDAKKIYEYEIKNSSLKFEISISETDEDTSYNIEKIIDDLHNISARVNFKNVTSIEFNTGNNNDTTVIKICNDDSKYIAITEDTYYVLGYDIENITFEDGRFYFLSYNPKYEILRRATDCGKETKSDIENFKMSDYYYNYGKINFLKDYYQKLASKKVTVKERCEELESKLEE